MQRQPVRIRLLGELEVRRSDGSFVALEEWRTGKTRDLLRLLALADGHPVRASTLIDKLWPEAPSSRARNSLRTAASQIRRTAQEPCVVRQADALTLVNAWVDVNQFRTLGRRLQLAARGDAPAEVLTYARAAEWLYRDDFHAHDDDSPWAVAERDELRQLRQQMLSDASVAALDQQLFREALDLATTAVRLDPTSETAHRSLMRAHAELGEVGMALRVFESYRAHLADELGVDPSPQTQELHLHLLRGAADGKQASRRAYPTAG